MLSFKQEYSRRMEQIKSDSIAQEFELFISNTNTQCEEVRKRVFDIFDYVSSVDYIHPGGKNPYLNHLLRMCNICYDLYSGEKTDLIILILVHNLLEVSNISYDELEHIVGHEMAAHVEMLTVDRAKEWDIQYKQNYYAKIAGNEICACTKIIDKIDNIFLISMNPDKEIRDRYLDEVEYMVVPLAEKLGNLPDGHVILSDAIRNIRKS